MKKNLPILIISGGSSSRMFPLNHSRHKGQLPLAGKSLIARTIDACSKAGFSKFVTVTNPNGDILGLEQEIERVCPQAEASFHIQEDTSTGMAGAVLTVEEQLDEEFLVIAPYHFSATDVLKEMTMHEQSVVCAAPIDTPWLYGMLSLEGNIATGIVEKPEKGTEPSNMKAQACYKLNKRFLELLKEQSSDDHYAFETALNQLMAEEEVKVIQLEKNLPSLKFPWHLFDFLQTAFDSFQETQVSSQANVASTAVLDDNNGAIVIEDGAKVGDFVKIVGPTYIGKNALVGDYSFVRNSCLEINARVGANTEVVRSIIMENSSIHYSYVADSIIDKNVKVGADLLTANKRFDRKEVKVSYKNKKYSSQRNALGVIVGEGANIGIRTATMPGVVITAEATVMPNQTLFSSVVKDE